MNANIWNALDNVKSVTNTLHLYWCDNVAAQYPRAAERLTEARELVAATPRTQLPSLNVAIENTCDMIDDLIKALDMDSHRVLCAADPVSKQLQGLALGLGAYNPTQVENV